VRDLDIYILGIELTKAEYDLAAGRPATYKLYEGAKVTGKETGSRVECQVQNILVET